MQKKGFLAALPWDEDRILRNRQFQQNFPRELAMSEAAALAGADALQFRIDHASEERAAA
jgi:hypothetical protein